METPSVETNIPNFRHFHLPDLNVDIARSIPDLNINIFSFKNSQIDSSSELHFEDEMGDETFEPHLIISEGENIVEAQAASSGIRKKKNLTNNERQAVYTMLQQKSNNGRLGKEVTRLVPSQFSVSMRTIQRIWKQTDYGRKRVEIDFERIRGIPLHRRTTIRSLACSLQTKKSTLFRRFTSGEIRRHSNAIKPFLKEENKKVRLQFCISMLERDSIPHDPSFIGMYNFVHIDEKWFYMTKKMNRYYLLPDEEDPLRTCKSKNFIAKVMFLAAIARPRFDAHGNETFSGKIGVFPFVTHEPAKRTSVNRVAGTLETKPITSVNKEVIRSYLIEKVLPAIKEKWPREDAGHPIFIQQDNARTHVDRNDELFRRAASQDGFDIRLISQPPNSPDLNILDLGFFSAIQSLQYKEPAKTVDELLAVVQRSFQAFPSTKSNRILITLQSCMIEIMKVKGSNKYKIPHIKKAMMERVGQLPTHLKCDSELVQEVFNYLS
ncbi:hypothetical protein ABFS83_14G127700 [Erythranthe nasuta]